MVTARICRVLLLAVCIAELALVPVQVCLAAFSAPHQKLR